MADMDVDDSVEPPRGINLTACLVLNQRDDERLGFDFVSFPGNNEVLGVVDLTPGAHFVYVKKEEYNDEIDMRIGEFVYVAPDTCTVLKRRKDDDGALFEVVEPEEAKSYHSSIVSGHFNNKLAKVPQQLRELWFNLTEFITEDVMRALRPLQRKVSSKSKFSARVEPVDSCQPISEVNDRDSIEEISQEDQSNPMMRRREVPPIGIGSPRGITVESHNTETGNVNENMEIESQNRQTVTETNNVVVTPISGEVPEVMSNKRECPFVAFNTQDEDDTVEDYIEIAKHFKGMKNRTGLICETLNSSKCSGHGTGPEIDKSDQTNGPYCGVKLSGSDAMSCSTVSQDCISKEVIQTETVLDSELAADQCTVYYSDLRRINKRMTLLSMITPGNVTQMHLDTTHILDAIAANHRRFKASSHGTVNPTHKNEGPTPTDMNNTNSKSSYEDVLGEYQYAFCLFLLNFHYDSFEHWKAIFRAICGAEAFFVGHPELAEKVLNVMRLQLETFESDLYEPDNFFAYYLNSLEEIITDNQDQLAVLREPFERIRNTFKLKFGISLEDAKILQENIQIVDEHGN